MDDRTIMKEDLIAELHAFRRRFGLRDNAPFEEEDLEQPSEVDHDVERVVL